MSSFQERKLFSARLQQALRNADYPTDSPTRLAREFNVRYAVSNVTVHAARKWLLGEAIPTQEKLRALAAWLGVSAQWLRFGGDNFSGKSPTIETKGLQLEPRDLTLIENLRRLDDKQRRIVHTLIRELVHASGKK